MKKEIILTENEKIKSIDLVKIINTFRLEEGKKELRHDSFITKIRKELETLKTLGLEADQNILEGSYLDKNGQERPCYLLNRDGMLMMLNSESTLVRYKTVEYVNKLEKENAALKEDNSKLYEVAISDKEQQQRLYEANKIKFALRNINSLLSDCNYTNLEQTVKDIIDNHKNLKKKDRYAYHQDLTKTEYVMLVKQQICNKLKNIKTEDPIMLIIVNKIIAYLNKELLSTTNRRVAQKIKSLQNNIEELESVNEMNEAANEALLSEIAAYEEINPSFSDYHVLNIHGFSIDCVKDYNKQYYDWKEKFPKDKVIKDDVDFSKPVYVYMQFDHMKKFDVTNFHKTFIDAICRVYGVDDKYVQIKDCSTHKYVKYYNKGKIYYKFVQGKEIA